MAKKSDKVEFEFQPGGVQPICPICDCPDTVSVVGICLGTIAVLAVIGFVGWCIYGAIYDAGKQAGHDAGITEVRKELDTTVSEDTKIMDDYRALLKKNKIDDPHPMYHSGFNGTVIYYPATN